MRISVDMHLVAHHGYGESEFDGGFRAGADSALGAAEADDVEFVDEGDAAAVVGWGWVDVSGFVQGGVFGVLQTGVLRNDLILDGFELLQRWIQGDGSRLGYGDHIN